MGIMKASLSTIHHSKPSTVTPVQQWAGGAGCRVTDEMVFCGLTFPAQTPDRDVCLQSVQMSGCRHKHWPLSPLAVVVMVELTHL